MYLKLMTGDHNVPDSDPLKSFRLMQQVVDVEVQRESSGALTSVTALFEDGSQETFLCSGRVYIMNDQGRTVASFGKPDGIKREIIPVTDRFDSEGGIPGRV